MTTEFKSCALSSVCCQSVRAVVGYEVISLKLAAPSGRICLIYLNSNAFAWHAHIMIC